MDKNDFTEVMFDSEVYASKKRAFAEMAERLPQHLKALADEGLPCTIEFVQLIAERDTAFYDYIMKLLSEQIGRGWMPRDERERLTEVFRDLYSRLIDDVNAIRCFVSRDLPLIDVGGVASADFDEVEALANKAATRKIDATKVQAYWGEVNKLIGAMADVRAFEKKNGLPSFVDSELSFVQGGRPQRYDLKHFLERGGGAGLFQKIAAPYFTKK